MILGIGTDIVTVARLRRSLERHGDRLAERILTATELAEYARAAHPEAFLAKRFAVKEAAAKAFGTGFSGGLALSHIGVTHDPRGRPELVFRDRARELAERRGVGQTFVSISDEREHAVAFVILTDDPPA